MDTRIYTATASVLLKPVSAFRHPQCRVNGQDIILDKETWFDITFTGSKDTTAKIQIEHINKNCDENLIQPGTDIAIIVEQIKLNEITSPKFIWQGVYTPNYPAHFQNPPTEIVRAHV